jgi:2-polyprenyl-3-methyl-5-hydroxy-6-metoxy-1,4-benzoquinol methylase
LKIIGSRDIDYRWKDAGEEWSEPWGSSEAQWFGTVFPRISEYLPAATILEIAPGFGRWTHQLKEHCQRLQAVDSDARCIEACRRRFGQDSRLSYHVNDGRSLAMIPDRSIDFAFSFDSLVHVPSELVEAYLRQLADKLTEDGVGFIHHSNLGEYASSFGRHLPQRARKLLTKAKLLEQDYQRAPDMTAELFQSCCASNGLRCLQQELINWRGRRLIDCFTTFAPAGSKWTNSSRIIRNPNFMREARLIRKGCQRTRG